MTAPFSTGAPKRMSKAKEALAWTGGVILSVALAFTVYSLASAPFTTTVDSKVALPKELAITAQEATIRLPAPGAVDAPTTTTTAAPVTEAPVVETAPSTTVAPQAPLGSTGAPVVTNPPAATTTTTRAPSAPTTATPTTAAPAPTAAPTTAAPVTSAPTTAAPTTTPVLPTPRGDSSAASDENRGLIRDLVGGVFGSSSNEGKNQ